MTATLKAERDRLTFALSDARMEIATLVNALETINRLTSPGSRTLDDFIRDMGYACDHSRAALEKARRP